MHGSISIGCCSRRCHGPRLGLQPAGEGDGELQHLLELDETHVGVELLAGERAGRHVPDDAGGERPGHVVGAGLRGGRRAVDLLHGARHRRGAVRDAPLDVRR
jgi:hypothetical protein